MTPTDLTLDTDGRRTATPPRISVLKSLFVWHAAWQEHRRLLRLDATELRDMGLTEADRRSVTVSQIVARMRR